MVEINNRWEGRCQLFEPVSWDSFPRHIPLTRPALSLATKILPTLPSWQMVIKITEPGCGSHK